MEERSLLIVERMVLEALGKRAQTAADLAFSLGLNEALVINILGELVARGLGRIENGGVVLEEGQLQDKLPKGKSLEREVRELFVSFVNYFFEQQSKGGNQGMLRLRKVSISDSDRRTLEAHMQNLDTFLRHLEDCSKECNVSEKRLFFWGHCPYGEVVRRSLKGV